MFKRFHPRGLAAAVAAVISGAAPPTLTADVPEFNDDRILLEMFGYPDVPEPPTVYGIDWAPSADSTTECVRRCFADGKFHRYIMSRVDGITRHYVDQRLVLVQP